MLSGDTATWDADGVAVPSVFKTDKYYMWYSGYSGFTKAAIQVKIGMAESTTGTSWTKLPANPVIDEAASGFGVGGVGAPWVMEHGAGGALEMWYSGLDTNMDSQVGYAVTGSITLTLTATLQGDRVLAGYNVPLTFKVYDVPITGVNLTSATPVAQFSTAAGIQITNTDIGTKTITFTVTAVPAGKYNVTLYTPHCLVNLKNNVTIPLSGGFAFAMGTLREGDAVDITAAPPSLVINIDDFVVFATGYETHGVILPTYPTASTNWKENADFDRDLWITIADFSLLYANYGLTSPRTVV